MENFVMLLLLEKQTTLSIKLRLNTNTSQRLIAFVTIELTIIYGKLIDCPLEWVVDYVVWGVVENTLVLVLTSSHLGIICIFNKPINYSKENSIVFS